MSDDNGWEYGHYESAFALFLSDDDNGEPTAVFAAEEDAVEWLLHLRRAAWEEGLLDFDGTRAAFLALRKPESYHSSAIIVPVANCFVPWLNSSNPTEAIPPPLPEYELAELVRLNAPEAGEDTLTAIERRLALWHKAKYGDKGVDIAKTTIKLAEEFGEFAKDIVKDRKKEALIELADIVIVCVHLARGLGGSIATALAEKIPIIEKRVTDALPEAYTIGSDMRGQ